MSVPPVQESDAAAVDAAAVLDSGEAGGLAIRGASLRGVGYLIAGLLGAVSAPLLIRHLGIVQFGRYTTVVALIAIVNGITEGGVGFVGAREYAQSSGAARDRVMRNLLGMRLVMTVTGCIGATLFAWVAGYGHDLVMGSILASVGLLFTVLQGTYAIPLYATLVIGRQVVGEVLRQAMFVLLVALLVILGAGVVSFLAASIPPAIGLLVYTLYLVRGLMPLAPSFEVPYWRQLLRDTLPVALNTIANTVYFRSVLIVMSLIATGHQLGLFATSYRIIEVVIGLPVLLVGTAFPILARAASTDEDRLSYGVGRLLELALPAGVGLAGATILAARPVLLVIGGQRASGATAVLQLQSIVLIYAFTMATVGFTLVALRRNAQLVGANVAALVLAVAATFVLEPSLGARGAALATVVGETTLLGVCAIFLKRARPGIYFPLRLMSKVALAAVPALGVALALPVSQTIRAIVFGAIYTAVLFALRAVPGELLAAFLNRTRRLPSTPT